MSGEARGTCTSEALAGPVSRGLRGTAHAGVWRWDSRVLPPPGKAATGRAPVGTFPRELPLRCSRASPPRPPPRACAPGPRGWALGRVGGMLSGGTAFGRRAGRRPRGMRRAGPPSCVAVGPRVCSPPAGSVVAPGVCALSRALPPALPPPGPLAPFAVRGASRASIPPLSPRPRWPAVPTASPGPSPALAMTRVFAPAGRPSAGVGKNPGRRASGPGAGVWRGGARPEPSGRVPRSTRREKEGRGVVPAVAVSAGGSRPREVPREGGAAEASASGRDGCAAGPPLRFTEKATPAV